MPVELEEIIRFMRNLGYEVKKPKREVVDELLGAFEGAIPEGETSTEYIRKLRESGYGKLSHFSCLLLFM